MLQRAERYKRVLVKGILQVFLGLSVFAFSGYLASASENGRSIQTIELVTRIQKRKRSLTSFCKLVKKGINSIDLVSDFLGRVLYEATLLKTLFKKYALLSGRIESFPLRLLIPVHYYFNQPETSISVQS